MAKITGNVLDLSLPINLESVIQSLENSFPDRHPRGPVSEFDLGYNAGAIEVIRRLKEYSSG